MSDAAGASIDNRNCPETQPICENCTARRLICVYPMNQATYGNNAVNEAGHHIVSPSLPPAQPSPLTFSLQDMRFFHHYLMVARPYLPFGSGQVWVAKIPQIATQHGFIMHAILSLGATHLSMISPNLDESSYAKAVVHRGHAIKGFRELLDKQNPTSGDFDALLATAYCLATQTAHMTDALQDFLVFIRGCARLSILVAETQLETVFPTPSESSTHLPSEMETMTIDLPLMASGVDALQQLSPILQGDVHFRFRDSMATVLQTMKTSCLQAFKSHQSTYAAIYSINDFEFNQFIALENSATHVLFCYHFAVEAISMPMLLYLMPDHSKMPQAICTQLQWVDAILEQLPSGFEKYLLWPLEAICYAGMHYGVFNSARGEKLQKKFFDNVRKYKLEIELQTHSLTPSIYELCDETE
ncbi:hypothetical protein FQN57_006797 [Myotisia sp. PD_48]|nr:hypothetical protein FQN57_006797 [Myotisia sp. PD_48]